MNEDESPIHSMNVSLGTAPRTDTSGPAAAEPRPWVVLFCSDLGFRSRKSEPVTAATLNEFFSRYPVTISGPVETGLPDDIPPFYLEYTPEDVKDFSPSALAGKLPLLKRLKNASVILEEISRGRIPAGEGIRKVAAMDLPQGILRQLGNCVPAGTETGGATAHASQKSAAVDSILAMMDVGENAEPAPAVKQDDLAAILSAHSSEEINTSGLNACKDSIERLTATLGEVVVRQSFYRTRHSSWNALKTVCKAVGRNRSVRMYLHSAPSDAAYQHLGDALQTCAQEGAVPDLVVWDYPVATDTASTGLLEQVGDIAEQYKSMVVVPIDAGDALYNDIIDKKPLATVVAQPAYIPLRRLQEKSSSRCISLCAPQATVVSKSSSGELPIEASWLLALQWIVSCTEYSAPFHLQNASITVLESFEFPSLPGEVASDGYQSGLTILRPDGVTVPRVLLGDSDSPFGSMLFNICVNRTARLTADWISGFTGSPDDAATALQQFLKREFVPFGFEADEQVFSVTADGGGNLSVQVDSSMSIAGFRVAFDFTAGYRG